jgi:hypothetical protein
MTARGWRASSRRRSGRAVLPGLLACALEAIFAAPDSHAQGPATSSAAPVDGGATVDSTYGCVESVPKGAQKPIITDTFPPRGTSGWAATLSITVRHGKGERVLPSGLDLSSAVEAKKVLRQAGFVVPDQDGGAAARLWTEPDDSDKPDATTHIEMPLVLLPPNPGRNAMVLPPLPVAVARANGEIATVCTHAHTIFVDDPIANTPDAMPRENPPGMPQREEWTALKKAVGWGSLGLLAGALLAYLIWRWMSRPKPEPPPPPPRPPWEVALEELDAVRHAGLLEVKRYSEYFDRTSDALRRYLGARFGFDGLESTTDEILEALEKQGGGFIRFDTPASGAGFAGPTPGVSYERVARLLRECDLVKFANLTPTAEQCAAVITEGEAIVRATIPTSTDRTTAVEPPAPPPADPIAAAQLRSPYEPPPEPPPRQRSPWEPPRSEERPAEASSTKTAGSAEAPAPKRSPWEPPEGGSS